jgi:hypothetical protein
VFWNEIWNEIFPVKRAEKKFWERSILCRFLRTFFSNLCENIFIHQHNYQLFEQVENRRGNLFCSRWFLFIRLLSVGAKRTNSLKWNSEMKRWNGAKLSLSFLIEVCRQLMLTSNNNNLVNGLSENCMQS